MHALLPPAPSQWQGTEYMQHWLTAKVEEDRRIQEEERTRQESLRLEQRKFEHKILLESLQAGVPPHMIPFVFSSMNGGGNSNRMLDMLQKCTPHVLCDTSNQASSYQQGSSPSNPVTLPPISQQSPQVTPPESYANWQKRMEAYFGGSQATNAKKSSGKNSSRPSSKGQVAPRPVLRTPQRTLVQPELRPHQSSASVPFLQWIPPIYSHSHNPREKTESPQPPHLQSTSQPRSKNSPSLKRKSQSSHHRGLPPPSHSSDEGRGISRLDTQSPTGMIFHNFGPDHPHQQSDASLSHESQTMDVDSDQVREQVSRLVTGTTTENGMEGIRHEYRDGSPERYSHERQSQTQAISDAENVSDLPQQTGRHPSGRKTRTVYRK
ncbi:hypothetical protein N7492_008539 [Penicillium capsulatum]|uniref:Uncharacterized protein n=1 Tax=Penicillium capsulatum TaxID=69766 RepID=A0A9W9HTN2_9EURO|nr:hypothetical protein N7492_008539 [Penicillium capsulatum]KAJ6105944.1 hypothetical protein N7512_009461 [Penicillium capsulatum]